ncbi:MAG: Xaa-Pro peptidase family protein [Clostridium sp.]|nr:Xaa-Pro peptidase family protein [Prevotella sp.]MCM1429053.1 Xaa-Pro peptidase family protein [Clostridium sp.]MCM1475416.1 Xaa-Pro peptidase family protein [Muribaculaceae bacterium]
MSTENINLDDIFIPEDFKTEIRCHIDRIQQSMRPVGLDAILVASNANIYYTTGRVFRGYVYVPSDGEPLYFLIRPSVLADSEGVVKIRKPELIAEALTERGYGMPGKVGLEFDTLPYSDILRLSKCFEGAKAENASGILREARMVKTAWEINEIRKDGTHQAAVYHRIPHLYKEDMTDLELQIEIERVLRLEGSIGMLRTQGQLMESGLGSVISGRNADTPSPYDYSMGGSGISPAFPVGANGTTMLHGTSVMIDMAGNFNGYQSDMTRVWRIGDISELATKAHNCSIRILRALEEMGLPGTECSELYLRAEEIAEEEGLADYFMGHRQKAGFIGHGVGIELNEQPAITSRCRTRLQSGMVIALEPKFVIPEVGAVGPENTYVVTDKGLEALTIFPEEINSLI